MSDLSRFSFLFFRKASRSHQQLAWYLLGILLMKNGAFNQLFGTYIYNIWYIHIYIYIHTLPNYASRYVDTDRQRAMQEDRQTEQTNNQTNKQTVKNIHKTTHVHVHTHLDTIRVHTRTLIYRDIHLNNYCKLWYPAALHSIPATPIAMTWLGCQVWDFCDIFQGPNLDCELIPMPVCASPWDVWCGRKV